jgi:hypothetical protein
MFMLVDLMACTVHIGAPVLEHQAQMRSTCENRHDTTCARVGPPTSPHPYPKLLILLGLDVLSRVDPRCRM